eukprot:TRINITY_DN27658_c0_g1_i1.p1 TRINITY_DN27658_c0_g1~~TRINITY_DN27658_c0_g1_i1.p1  ORF type:complete len:263 (-),score=44.66 TRINITY_DN27658_c0_g1_i1:136-924(-)
MLRRLPRVEATRRLFRHEWRPDTLEFTGRVPLRLRSAAMECCCAASSTRLFDVCTSHRRQDPRAKDAERTSDSQRTHGQPSGGSYRNVLDGVSLFELLTISPRHLLSAAALELLSLRRPGIWNGPEFFQGAQQAIRAVFELLADADIEALEELVDARLLASLIGDDARTAAARQAWSAPPMLQSVRLLGLVGAGGQEEGDQRRVLVTSVFCTCEEYSYACGKTELLRRIQKWTFARQLDRDCSWILADVGSMHWLWEQDVVE